MAITVHRRTHAGRAFAHNVGRRSPLAGRYANVSAATELLEARDNTVVEMPPTSTQAFTGAFVVLALITLCITTVAVWKLRAKKAAQKAVLAEKAKQTTEKSSYPDEKSSFDSYFGFSIEKPQAVVCHDPITPPTGRWVPQLRADLKLPTPTAPRSNKAKQTWEKNLAKFITDSSTPITPGPPAYVAQDPNAIPNHSVVMPPMPKSAKPASPMPPTPMKPSSIETPPVTPQSSGSASSTNPFKPSSPKSAVPALPLPRLMSVTSLFAPSLADELALAVGQKVMLIEEYADDWCLVETVGQKSEKGVVPRFCLSERRDSVPRLPSLGLRPTDWAN